MLSRIGAVSIGITQLGHGTPNPSVPMVFPPLFSTKPQKSCHATLQQALARIPAPSPDHTKPLLPSGRWTLALCQSFSCQHRPWMQTSPRWQVDGYSVPRFAGSSDGSGDVLPCAGFLLLQLTGGRVSCGHLCLLQTDSSQTYIHPPPTKMETTWPKSTLFKPIIFSFAFILRRDFTRHCF